MPAFHWLSCAGWWIDRWVWSQGYLLLLPPANDSCEHGAKVKIAPLGQERGFLLSGPSQWSKSHCRQKKLPVTSQKVFCLHENRGDRNWGRSSGFGSEILNKIICKCKASDKALIVFNGFSAWTCLAILIVTHKVSFNIKKANKTHRIILIFFWSKPLIDSWIRIIPHGDVL